MIGHSGKEWTPQPPCRQFARDAIFFDPALLNPLSPSFLRKQREGMMGLRTKASTMEQWFLVEGQSFWNKEKLALTTPFLFIDGMTRLLSPDIASRLERFSFSRVLLRFYIAAIS